MEENEGTSPAEQLAAEVASDTSETGEVTSDDVAEVLHLPKRGASDTAKDADTDEGDSDEADTADTNDDETEDSADSDDDEADEEDDDDEQEEATDTDKKQFVLKVTDANGKEFVIDPDDDLEKVLEDFEPKSNGQIMSVIKQLQDLKTAKEQYASDQEKQQTDAAYQKQVETIRTSWDSEIAALQGDKRIPVEADGKVPARVTEVFKFMREQNDKRLQDGRPLLQSFEDALDKLELKESKDDTVKKNKDEKVLARKRGAIVGGSSAAATSGVSSYKRGARNPIEALKQMGVLH